MKVDRLELLESLRRVVAVVDPKSAVAILQYVCFTDGTIQGSSGVTGVVTRAPRLEQPFCIAGDWLLALLAKLDKDEVDLSIENTTLFVRCGRHVSKAPTVDAKRFPCLLSSALNTVSIPCGPGFQRAISEVLGLTYEAKQANLQGIGLWKNFVYGTDGCRATRCSWDGNIPEPVVLPRESVALLAKHGDPKTIRLGAKVGNACLTYDGFVLISRLLSSKLPFAMIDQIANASPAVCVDLPDGVDSAIDRVRLMGGEGGLSLEALAGVLRVSMEKPECVSQETLEIPNAPDFALKVTKPEQLLEIFKRTRHCDLTDVLQGHKRTLRCFKQEGSFELQHMLGLMI